MPRADAPLLLLSHTAGYGGGVERLASAVCAAWPAPVRRLDVYRQERDPEPRGTLPHKGRFVACAMRAALRERPAVVVALDVTLLPAAAAAARAGDASFAVYGAGREVWSPQPAVRRALAARCRHLLAISDFTAGQMALRLGVERARVRTTPLPIAPVFERAAAGADAVALAPHQPRILTVGRVARDSAYKGHDAIARSLPAVLRRVPDARWVVVGLGDGVPALRARCERLGIAASVDFRERVADAELVDLYRAAAALAMPSVARTGADAAGEGFGLVYAEAGAFGVPSIASATGGGSAEFVRDGVTGLTVPPGDDVALAAAIARLLEERSLRDRLGAAARALVLDRHTAAAYRRSLLAAIA